MEDKKLTTEESLDIITRMIASTRARLEWNSGRPFLIWGYTAVAVALLNFWLKLSEANPDWSLTWFLILIVGLVLMRVFSPHKSTEPRTELSRIINKVWLVLAIGIIPAFVMAIFSRTEVFGTITLLIAAGVAITGLVVRSRIYTVAGFTGMALSTAFAIFDWWLKKYVVLSDDNVWIAFSPILVYALVFTIMMVIPGHMLNAACKREAREAMADAVDAAKNGRGE